MAKHKQRNFLTGRTHAQQAYHLKRQASKRGTEAKKRDRRIARSGIGCAIPMLLAFVAAIAAARI